MIDGLGEVADKLTGLPNKGVDLTPLVIQRGELPRMDAVKGGSFVRRLGGPSLPDLIRGESGKGGRWLLAKGLDVQRA